MSVTVDGRQSTKGRKEHKQETLARRFQYNLGQARNLTLDELGNELWVGRNPNMSHTCRRRTGVEVIHAIQKF